MNQTGACLASRRLECPKQAPVYSRADCVAPNWRLFAFAQIAGPQTGACLALHKMQDPKQAPVCLCAGLCRGRGSLSWYPAKLPSPGRGPVCLRPGLCRGRGSLSWYPAKLPSPGRGPVWLLKLLRFEDGIVVRERRPRRSGEGLLRGRDPIKISAGCLLLRPTKVFE